MNKFEELLTFVEAEHKKLKEAHSVVITTTEKWMLEGRITDVSRILSEGYKIKNSEQAEEDLKGVKTNGEK